MLAHYLRLAARNLARSPGLTVLMMLAVGVGVGSSMTTYAVVRGLSGDPIPSKSTQLFVPQIDAWGPGRGRANGEPPEALSYVDAANLLTRHRGLRQSAIYEVGPSLMPTDDQRIRSPLHLSGDAVDAEFFPMLEVPFRYGGGWSRDDEARRRPLAVISDRLSRQVFGDGSSIGRTLDIDHHVYTVVGVMRDWNPQPRFFEFDPGYSAEGPDLFVPFSQAVAAGMSNEGGDRCPKGSDDPDSDFGSLLRSDCVWIAYLVELPNRQAVQQYREDLLAYARSQQEAGRLNWPLDVRLRDLPAFLDRAHVVPDDTRLSLLVAASLLAVCLLNTVGLLLARFLRRGGEIGLRRALGASRATIHAQFLVEAGVIGLGGGLLGLLFTGIGMLGVDRVLPPVYARLAEIDGTLFALTLGTAVLATLLASLYPAYRASRIEPAWQLKIQ